MKKIITFCISLLLFSTIQLVAQINAPQSFNYTGSNWDKYNDHQLTIVVLDTSVGGTKLITEQIIKNGRLNVSGKMLFPQNAFFGLYNPDGDFVYKKEFIIEPGELKLDLDGKTNDLIVSGGKYNPIFLKIQKDSKYLALLKKVTDFSSSMKPEDFRNDTLKRNKYLELNRAANTYKTEAYNQIRFHNSDPLARLLAMYHSDKSVRYLEQLNDLEKELGELPEIVYLKYSLEAAKRRTENRVTITTGSVIKDFSGNDLNGNTFHLNKILVQNKYTLVEFWASWCGPCRAEIPNMKKAYKKFNEKGFEIISFSLDHEKDRWMKASEEEALPWINVGDLLAYKSPVVTMFGINGIPANYLVDPSGKIIAMNLRGDKLDEKLSGLLGM